MPGGLSTAAASQTHDDAKDIGILIYSQSDWGALDSKGGKATREEVVKFFDTALAICKAESGFNAKAENGTAVGLFQIKTDVHKALIAGRDMTDPKQNIAVASAISRQAYSSGKSMWSPWEVYTNGSYKSHLGDGKRVYVWIEGMNQEQRSVKAADAYERVSKGKESFLSQVVPGNPMSAIGDAVQRVLDFLQKGVAVAGVFIIGSILLILGIIALLPKDKMASMASGASSLLPAGRALKAVKSVAS